MTIGERIRNRRIELNMTQEELAKKAGYKSRSSINKIELSRDLPLNKIAVVAKALDCSPGYLAGWDSECEEFGYYHNKETIKKAQNLFETPGMRVLFDAARNSRPEDLQMAADLLKRLKETNPNG